jgi:hypothetical protein
VTMVSTGGPNSTAAAFSAAAGLIAWDRKDDTVPAIADLPDPIDNGELDWINRYVSMWPQEAPNLIVSPSLDDVHLSKAKRKLGQDKGILCVFSTSVGAGAPAGIVNFAADIRCLIKE